ncbi:MAG: hypothetical protein ACLQKA_13250 [Bryobacteraceae bacterium]
MGPKKTFEHQGRKVQGQSVEFTAKSENWQQYELEDGSQLKVKIVLLDVVRLDEYSDNGDPVYQLAAQQLIGIQVPDELKKKVH